MILNSRAPIAQNKSANINAGLLPKCEISFHRKRGRRSPIMAYDPKDDVDKLFACFKCGVSPPPSAYKDWKSNAGKLSRSAKRGSPVVNEKEEPSCSRQVEGTAMEWHKCGSSATAAVKFRSGKQISPVVFYGSPHGVPVKRPSRILRLLQEIRIDLREENALISRDGVWATFPRQEEAVRFARTHTNSNVFSYQDHFTGQRRFLVSTYDEFWRRYKSMDSKLRHHYEVIQEGHPCHLYFDLEFNKRLNVGRSIDEMVDILMAVVITAVSEKYSIRANRDFVVELDSSTEEKSSRHLIIRLPKTAFKDNLHVGAFVSEICLRIASLREKDPLINKLYIKKDSNCSGLADYLFLDTAVYSRNRCFRLPFSSKASKSSFLLPTSRFRSGQPFFYYGARPLCGCANIPIATVFRREDTTTAHSSVTRHMIMAENEVFSFKVPIVLLCWPSIDLLCRLSIFLGSVLPALIAIYRLDKDCEKILICKMDLDCMRALSFDAEVHSQHQNHTREVDTDVLKSNVTSSYVTGRSPFPALDAFVESISSIDNTSGKVQSWYWFSEYGLIVYNMSRHRYCERIGREHKSNHVMYVVDFQRAGYYQKCHDPDCKGYRSPFRPLPWDVLPDNSTLSSSPQIENYEVVSLDFDLQAGKNNMDAFDNEQLIDCCGEMSWWQEAIKFAEYIENMKNV